MNGDELKINNAVIIMQQDIEYIKKSLSKIEIFMEKVDEKYVKKDELDELKRKVAALEDCTVKTTSFIDTLKGKIIVIVGIIAVIIDIALRVIIK